MIRKRITQISIFLTLILFALNSCGTPGDARKISPNPKDRVKKNLEDGRGFRLMDATSKLKGNGNFEFASSNELWRASLDIIDDFESDNKRIKQDAKKYLK